MTDQAHYWVAYLATSVKQALSEPPETARSRLRKALDRFRQSPSCSDQLDAELGLRTRPRKTRPDPPNLNGYDLRADWKPCGNPECHAPIPKSSRKAYCDKLCKDIAGEYQMDEAAFRAKHPDYDQVPY